MVQETKVFIRAGYSGSVKVRAFVGQKQYILEIEELENLLAKIIDEKGFTESLAPRQQYPRLKINK